jgi:hypothetical protein
MVLLGARLTSGQKRWLIFRWKSINANRWIASSDKTDLGDLWAFVNFLHSSGYARSTILNYFSQSLSLECDLNRVSAHCGIETQISKLYKRINRFDDDARQAKPLIPMEIPDTMSKLSQRTIMFGLFSGRRPVCLTQMSTRALKINNGKEWRFERIRDKNPSGGTKIRLMCCCPSNWCFHQCGWPVLPLRVGDLDRSLREWESCTGQKSGSLTPYSPRRGFCVHIAKLFYMRRKMDPIKMMEKTPVRLRLNQMLNWSNSSRMFLLYSKGWENCRPQHADLFEGIYKFLSSE